MTNTASVYTAFTVQANQAWQNTNIIVSAGDSLTIAYQFGLWTANPSTLGENPYNAAGSPSVKVSEPDSYPLQGVQMGSLVGQIGNNPVFYVGNGPTVLPAGQSGPLQLCIDDDLNHQYGKGLADNSGSVTVFIYNTAINQNTSPTLTAPLINEPTQSTPPAASGDSLGPLQYLIGTWTNKLSKPGGLPYSYNVMPLPQNDPSSPTGYILKNFAYYEELTFSPIHGNAPNRSGSGTQTCNVLFYEQRVYFAEGPNKDALVHAENGSLLYLHGDQQQLGPYGNGDQPGLGNQVVSGNPPPQPYTLVKQVSVPHGNSILATSSSNMNPINSGSPSIPSVSTAPPSSIGNSPYTTPDPVTNPNPGYTQNPNQALTDALSVSPPTSYIQLDLSSQNGGGGVTNINFEKQYANVSQYSCTYWLEALNNSSNFTQLQYSQTIMMQMPITSNGITNTYTFPHVTTNTLTKMGT